MLENHLTLNEIRCNGFCVINRNAAVKNHDFNCVASRKLKNKLGLVENYRSKLGE